MAIKRKQPKEAPGDLYLRVENQDWVAIYGTRIELEQMGRDLMEFAQAAGPEEYCDGLDPIDPCFRAGSLGYTFYRRKPGWSEADLDAP